MVLLKAVGKLEITGYADNETYQVYFHVPIVFKEQVPLAIEIDCQELIDYRFIHLNPPNMIVSARLKQGLTNLDWTAWVLVKENRYSDRPQLVPLTALDELTGEEKKWLQSTDCAQLDAPIVRETAALVRNNTTNLIELADQTAAYCSSIPPSFSHSPGAFDAVYALKFGNACTGCAHAGAALLRANGVPARSILNLYPSNSTDFIDMHWFIDYRVPGYGWVNLETTMGMNFYNPRNAVIIYVSNPEDEFPVFRPLGLDVCWHTSEPKLGFDPDWHNAHTAFRETGIMDSFEKIAEAMQLSKSMFNYFSRYWGVHFNKDQTNHIFRAYLKQDDALNYLKNGYFDDFLTNIREALNHYKQVAPSPMETIFFDDFENTGIGWIHGGAQDEWEVGPPLVGPSGAHTGQNCWGVDLDDTYNNNADCWLLSPGIDLRNTSCAYLSFWLWNWVEDMGYEINDPLWLDLTVDGSQFYPICSHMGGVNDDPEIPGVGGWSRIVLDLSPYAGNVVRIRFRFQSNYRVVQVGSYIGDVHVYGRAAELEKNPISIELNTSIATERAWLIRKDSAKIELSINNPNHLKDLTVVIYKKEKGKYYHLFREITGNEIQEGKYTLFDLLPDPGVKFQYLAAVRDAHGKFIAFSYPKTI
jgi:transglutaminase-like putative cysteine protease